MSWLQTKLGNLLALEYGKALPRAARNETGLVPVAGSNGVDGFHDTALIRGPGIVVGRKGSAGKVTWFDGDFWPIDTTYYVQHDPRVTNIRWLFYLLQSMKLERLNKTTGVPGLNRKDVYAESCLLPPRKEQSRIVELLEEADRLRRLRREADAKAARILPALFLKMFGDPATNPMGWPICPLSEFADRVSRRNPAIHPDEKFPYIDIAGVDGETGSITKIKTLAGRDAPGRARQIVRWKDTLISTVRPYLRATAFVPRDLDEAIASTGFCVLRPKTQCGYAWLYQMTRQPWFTEQLSARARGASYPAVTDDDIFQLAVPTPTDPALLEKFDNKFESISATLFHASTSSVKVNTIFNLLLQKAFSGQLTAKWREAHIKELLAEMEQQSRLLNLPLPSEQEALA